MEVTDGERFDVVIVGAGPAGSSLAIRLATAGKSVLVIDKDRFPRHKLCGEFVSPECIEQLRDLGVWPAIHRVAPPELFETNFYSRNANRLSIDNAWLGNRGRKAIGLSRYKLDALLVDRARNCGVSVLEHSIVNEPIILDAKLDGLVIKTAIGKETKVKTNIAIDATGRSRALARLFGTGNAKCDNDQVAFKAHFTNAEIAQNVCEMFSFPGGYGGCLHVEDRNFNVCYIVDSQKVKGICNDRDTIFRKTFMTNRRAADVLSKATRTTDWQTVSIQGYGRYELSSFPGVLAVGDAAGFIDPFTGSGIALAFQTAKLCGKAILKEGSFDDVRENYGRSYVAAIRNRMLICTALRGLTRMPTFADRIIETISRLGPIGLFTAKGTRLGSVD